MARLSVPQYGIYVTPSGVYLPHIRDSIIHPHPASSDTCYQDTYGISEGAPIEDDLHCSSSGTGP